LFFWQPGHIARVFLPASIAKEKTMSDLRGFEPEPEETSSRSKIMGAAIIAIVVAAAGAYTYETGMWNPPARQQQVALNEPAPTLAAPAATPLTPPDTLPSTEAVPGPQVAPQAGLAAPVKAARVTRERKIREQDEPAAPVTPPADTITPVPDASSSLAAPEPSTSDQAAPTQTQDQTPQ
jgi:hypothetical protein